MKNKIGNVLYNLNKMKYRNGMTNNIDGVDFYVRRYEIVKETPKYLLIKMNILRTYNFGENRIKNVHYEQPARYKKDNVNMEGIETKLDLINRLDKTILQVENDDDISNTHKKAYMLSYDLIKDYLNNNEF